MDRVRIKERAKLLLKKNQGSCIAVAFLVTLLGGGGTSGGVSVNFTYSSGSTFTEDFSFEFLIMFLIIFAVALVFSFAFSAFVGSQVKVGSCRYFLKHRKNHPVEIGELFKSYSDRTFLNVAKVSFIKDIQIMLWSCLCFIPGIIKIYEYAAVPYILSVNPTMEYKRALDLSKRIMNGHKLEFFELGISFIGWYLLSAFTCGILAIVYVSPYYLIAEAEFFSYVRENAIFNGIISPDDIPDYNEYVPYNMYGYGAPNGNYYQQPTQNYNPTQPTPNYGYAPFTPAQPVEVPVAPVDEPVAPIDEPVAPVDEPIASVDEPVAPVDEPVAPTDEPTEAPSDDSDDSSDSNDGNE